MEREVNYLIKSGFVFGGEKFLFFRSSSNLISSLVGPSKTPCVEELFGKVLSEEGGEGSEGDVGGGEAEDVLDL